MIVQSSLIMNEDSAETSRIGMDVAGPKAAEHPRAWAASGRRASSRRFLIFVLGPCRSRHFPSGRLSRRPAAKRTFLAFFALHSALREGMERGDGAVYYSAVSREGLP